jgi:hypothetical protein
MYDGHNGMAYRQNSVGRRETWKALVRCYKNDGKMLADIRAEKRLAEQQKPEDVQEEKET